MIKQFKVWLLNPISQINYKKYCKSSYYYNNNLCMKYNKMKKNNKINKNQIIYNKNGKKDKYILRICLHLKIINLIN